MSRRLASRGFSSSTTSRSALAAGLPHGGGKAVPYGDPKMPKSDKQRLIRAFASALEAEAARATIPHICR
jgi:glutamate dehydrogenase/leucine dehydrogenase